MVRDGFTGFTQMKIISQNAIMVGLEKVDVELLNRFPNLKVIGCNCTGTEHLPLLEMEKRGIKLISLQGEREFLKTITSVSELTIWFMIELLRKPHNGRYIGNQLKDKCVGILGMGRIGTHVYNRVLPFGVDVLWQDKYEGVGLEKLLKGADILTIHIPLNQETGSLLTENHLKLMKPTAFIINTSRSQVFKEGVIEQTIREKWIAGYGTDVVRDDKEMQRLKDLQKEGFNVIITEHVAGNTQEALKATEDFIRKKITNYLHDTITK